MRRLAPGARAVAALTACAVLVGCGADDGGAPNTPSTDVVVTITSGTEQRATAGQPLPQPIKIKVVDTHGHPVAGVGVEWIAQQDSDVVSPAHSVTGSSGIAETSWTLGPLPGEHIVIASVAGFGEVTVRANADPAPLVMNAIHVLTLETPDGSGQTVHPDLLTVDVPGPLQSAFMAITPYPFGNSEFENPGLYESLDRMHWTPTGTNPVALPQRGFLSDPDVVFNPVTSELWMYYRQVESLNQIMLIRSSDARAWSEPQEVAFAFNHQIVSPAVVRRSDTEWLMWAVNGQSGCDAADTWVELRRSEDGLTWSAPQRVTLPQQGFKPWHIDVQWIPTREEYWAVYNVKPPESCSSPALYLATSKDGVTWTTYPSPVLARGDIQALTDIVYRASFRYRPDIDAITFAFSGAQFDGTRYVWRTAIQRRPRIATFDAIAKPPTAARVAALVRSVPPILDPP